MSSSYNYQTHTSSSALQGLGTLNIVLHSLIVIHTFWTLKLLNLIQSENIAQTAKKMH
ncbi:hypothetical protein HanXRQr2_Chr11g0501251 [Helianthus annuus]|uniref:Uncharacterized protein n=1 Tax=Helianthus annuus TaxID=4232 RepID=A0A9K3HQX6_HELAN|nr:hypothetical protein HanXRQr2_Chr11g0501251 [Helianthus annuus]KAJ0875973.1 hypothetical protein HanPSC8_Chr11g0483051 [Helianthus annuus]